MRSIKGLSYLLAVAIVLATVRFVTADIGPALIQATSIELGSAGTVDTTITRASAGVVAVEGTDLLSTATGQPLDSDLTSWAGVTRASGFDTFTATPSMANLGSLLTDEASGWITFGTTPSSANLKSVLTDETGSGGAAVFATSPVLTTPEISAFELGAGQTDTTFTRVSAGVAAIEGVNILTTSTGKAVGKQTIYVSAGAMKADATSPASCGDTFDSGSNDVTLVVCAFDSGATEERADFLIALPKSYNGGTFTYQTLWTAASGSGTFQAEVGCVFFRDDDALNATLGTTVTQSDTLITAGDMHVSSESSAVTCGGTYATGASAFFRVSRDTSVDTLGVDALLIGIRIFHTDNAGNDN